MKRAPPKELIILIFVLSFNVVYATPTIDYVQDFPSVLEYNENVTILTEVTRENITNPGCYIDTVLANITYMNGSTEVVETFEMSNTSDPYRYGGTFTIAYKLNNYTDIYYYNIFVNESSGNYTKSDRYTFGITKTESDEVIISVEVSPDCGVGFSFYFVPEEVTREQTVFFMQINENIGNMDVNETSSMYIEYNDGTLIWGPYLDQTTELEPWEDDLHYGLWKTYNSTALGVYYWHGITRFVGRTPSGMSETFYDWPDYNQTANCTKPEDIDFDGENETTCYNHFSHRCFNAYAKEYQFNTTSSSSLTLENQTPNTTTYAGTANISNTIYNAYTFNMEDCSEYCYACISDDTNLTEDECSYSTDWFEGNIIKNELGNMTITSMDPNGRNVTFSETFTSCVDRYVVSQCEVNYTINKIACYDKIQCNGSMEIVEDFEVVKEFGGEEEQPSPETEPKPEPSPSPSPTPEPLPTPLPGPIEINIYPVEPEISGMQEQTTPVLFEIENLGSSTASDITLEPIVGEEWGFESAQIDTIDSGEKLNRTLFITPTYKVEPSTYAIPVQALDSSGNVLDLAYFWFEVLPGEFLAKIKILESPGEITLESDSVGEIPIMIKNVGVKPLTKISAKLENIENCIVNITSPELKLDSEEEANFNLKVRTRTGPKTCNAMLIIESKENAYAFSRIKINVSSPSALLPGGLLLIPLLLLFFIVFLLSLITMRRRGRYVGILYPISSIITIILIIYIFLWYMGLVPIF